MATGRHRAGRCECCGVYRERRVRYVAGTYAPLPGGGWYRTSRAAYALCGPCASAWREVDAIYTGAGMSEVDEAAEVAA